MSKEKPPSPLYLQEQHAWKENHIINKTRRREIAENVKHDNKETLTSS